VLFPSAFIETVVCNGDSIVVICAIIYFNFLFENRKQKNVFKIHFTKKLIN
jgi:hypothetical protein